MKYNILLGITLLISACNSKEEVLQEHKKLVIFETDMGNDIDDALALDMLYKYQDQEQIELIGVGVNKQNDYSPKYIDILNTWYGYPSIPIGFVSNGVEDTIPVNFAKAVVDYSNNEGRKFDRSLADTHQFEDAVTFYRRMLSAQKDTSVTIVSVGFLTNLANLLDSEPDNFSSLSGKELIRKKVKKLSLMGGNFDGSNPKEYNIVKDVKSSAKVFLEWPTVIVVSPFEVGANILFPSEEIEKNLNYSIDQPVVVGYKAYLPMPYNRPTWDLTSILEVVDSQNNTYFDYSKSGVITVDDEGVTKFSENVNGNHRYLLVNEIQRENILKAFINIISSTKSKKHI
ncbi:nucleoside hydrolase [Sphingobacterium bovistauri]|uniref:Nucleoside hydrolase n=1 Tax=Sphingobacterium bovistauri TaxID=2781959 RepID=A0ABS7Z8F0_9SPHI|nr:nucleoside hydrolase [Sphingobacterium bovistauri]MCA5006273.1 nucleoside hydrolase [Sphingobacterium bovistauri]